MFEKGRSCSASVCVSIVVLFCFDLRKSNNLLCISVFFSISLSLCFSFPSTIHLYSDLLSGGHLPTYPRHCSISATGHQPDSHHHGSRARSDCKYFTSRTYGGLFKTFFLASLTYFPCWYHVYQKGFARKHLNLLRYGIQFVFETQNMLTAEYFV